MPGPIGEVLLRAIADRRRHIRSMAAYRLREVRKARRRGLPMIELICHACKSSFSRVKRYSGRAYYCALCAGDAHYARMYATAEVSRSVKLGVLMRADQFRCTDCDDWATCWDHRDYSKPFQVEPVCNSCNSLRPPGYQGTPRFSNLGTSTDGRFLLSPSPARVDRSAGVPISR